MGKLLGISFQQVQKYENGTNRTGSSRLWDISKVLEVPIGFFFEDMPPEIAEQSPRRFSLLGAVPDIEEQQEMLKDDPMSRAESYELIYDYFRISNRKLAKALKDSLHEAARTNYETLKAESE